MYCQNCGTRINENDTYCWHCGVSTLENKENLDEELLKCYVGYVGTGYEEINKKGFSFWTFFFGINYFLYRKMYLLAVLWFAAVFFLNSIFGNISYFFTMLGLILLSCNFKSIYIDKAKNDIEKIKQKYPSLEKEKLKNICARKGGTNIALPLVLNGLGIAFIITIFILFMVIGNVVETEEEFPSYPSGSNYPTTTLYIQKL